MPRNKTESHERIVEAAKKEFLEHGYADASLRRIADAAMIGVSGLYKHFANKEEMFEALVEPAVKGFYALYSAIEDEYFEDIGKPGEADKRDGQRKTIRVMEYMYDHYDEFILIITRSAGTRYENFTHEVAELEEEATLRYMDRLRQAGYTVKDIDRSEFHLLITAYMESVFVAVSHEFPRDKAMHYANTLEEFYQPAWKSWLGL